MKKLNIKFYILAGMALCGFAGTAMATPVGSLNIANCLGGGVTVSATTITWLPSAGAGVGCIDTGLGTSVAYNGGSLGSGVAGTIQNLVLGGGVVDNFMNFTGTPLDFALTSLGSFVLTPSGPNTNVSLAASGTVADGDGTTSYWQGSFTTQIVNMSPADILAIIDEGGSITSTHSGSFAVTAIPEPMTLSMMGIGLLGLGLIARRKKS